MTTHKLILENLALSAAMRWDPEDPTLSTGEAALADVVHTLADHLDSLDGDQQQVLADLVGTVSSETQKAEQAGLRMLGLG